MALMRRQHGFTLIELMVVLVVLAILTAIAYPSYTSQVMKSRRADGIAALNRAAMEMESCRSDQASYFHCELKPPPNQIHNRTSEDGFYLITTPASATATAYSLVATPVVGSAQANDTRCTTLTLDSQGNRGYSGTAPDADTCWGQ